MERRKFLELSSGMALGAMAGGFRQARSRGEIVIIGGGIVGASICYRLASRGARVTLLERSRPAAGATGRSFAWVNANFTKQPRHYHMLNRLGIEAFRSLHLEIGPELPVRWGGTIEWYSHPERAGELRREARRQQEWGYPIRFIDGSEMMRLEPQVSTGKTLAAAFSQFEGEVDPVAVTEVLLRRARAAGAKVIYPCEVTGISLKTESGVSVGTTRGDFNCDALVLAAGVRTQKLAELAGVVAPLIPAPGIVVRTAPQPKLVRSVLVTEDSHFRQQLDGRFVLGDDYGPPATEIHRHLASEPDDFPDRAFSELHGERIRAQAARYLPRLKGSRIERVDLCWRPMPKDGFPIAGFAPRNERIYLAATHSGVTLGPLLGELAAMEILDDVRVDLLEHYRPSRFAA